MTKSVGTLATCVMCGKEFVRRRAGALNCRKKCSQDYSNYRSKQHSTKIQRDISDMDRAWRFALCEMPTPCDK